MLKLLSFNGLFANPGFFYPSAKEMPCVRSGGLKRIKLLKILLYCLSHF